MCLTTLKVLCLTFVLVTAAAAADWKPINSANVALQEPKVDPDADAEAIFWEVRIVDGRGAVWEHYLRIKIFTERGAEEFAQVHLFYRKHTSVEDIRGRTIKPDGAILPLDKKTVFERNVVKARGVKMRAKSFAMPGVEAGVIIEYQWRYIEYRWSYRVRANYELDFQRDIPVWRVNYYVKPLATSRMSMRFQVFNHPPLDYTQEPQGAYSFYAENMPAYKEEPRMPPEKSQRVWMLIYYRENKRLPKEQFWQEHARDLLRLGKTALMMSGPVKKAVAAVTAEAATTEEKADRIAEYCRTKIKNLSYDTGISGEERAAKRKENRRPEDTLKKGVGTYLDITMLFVVMARAAGLTAAPAIYAPRDRSFFSTDFLDGYFLRGLMAAVRVEDDWRFYVPGTLYVADGMLPWSAEGVHALILDHKNPTFVQTPMAGPEQSFSKRDATFRLAEDGTLDGHVRLEYSGHVGRHQKLASDQDSTYSREEAVRKRFTEQFTSAEVTNVTIENLTDRQANLVYEFDIRILLSLAK